jgi:hypothetical protein
MAHGSYWIIPTIVCDRQTIDAWIKLDNPNVPLHQAITANTNTTAEKGHFFAWENFSGEQGLRVGIVKGVAQTPVIDSSSPHQLITDTAWHHVAAVGNGSTVTFFVDGTAYPGTNVMGTMSSGPSTHPLDIGHFAPPFMIFGGLIDEVHVWNRALGNAEVQALYASNIRGLCPCADTDGDGFGAPGDATCAAGAQTDCDDGNPLVWSAPVEVTNLRLASQPSTSLAWDAQGALVGTGVTYDVLRGNLSVLPVGSGSEVCESSGASGTTATDGAIPPPGSGFWYLVRGHDSCGAGTYGYRRDNGAPGAERMSTTCP